MSQSPEGSIYMEYFVMKNFLNLIVRLSRPKAQSTWNQRHTYENKIQCCLSRPKAQSTWNKFMIISENLLGVSVARRLNLHGIYYSTKYRKGIMSQSPEGSIYMEYKRCL